MLDNNGSASALIVARSADLREGLHSLLTVTPLIGSVNHASDGKSALQDIEKRCPSLVLLDCDLPYEDVLAVLRRIKEVCPCTLCLGFTDYTGKRGEIQSAGADLVLLKGHPAASLVAIIADLLGQR